MIETKGNRNLKQNDLLCQIVVKNVVERKRSDMWEGKGINRKTIGLETRRRTRAPHFGEPKSTTENYGVKLTPD